MIKNSFVAVLLFCVLTLTSCDAIAGIFKAGMGVGIFVVIIVIAVVLWIISKARK